MAGVIGTKKRDKIAYWTPEQFAAFILSKQSPRYIALFCLLFWTGCRIGEALALTPMDIDLTNRQMSITKTYTRLHKKGVIQKPKTPASIRRVALPSFLCTILADWIKRAGIEPNARLFEELELTSIEQTFHKHAEKIGLPRIRVHDLRHSHASLLATLGVSPVVIKERLGHENISTTIDTYSHLFPSAQKEAVSLLERPRD